MAAFSYISLDSRTKEPHVAHLRVIIGPSRIMVNSEPPQGWGFFKRAARTVDEFDV